MKVSIVRGGGFAGLVTVTSAETEALAPEDAALLRAKVEQADLLRPRARTAEPEPAPDRFDYALTVEDQGRAHTLNVNERDLTPSLRSLITYVSSVPGHREELTPPG